MRPRTRRFPAAVLGGLFVCSLLFATAPAAAADPPDWARAEHDRIVAFWTNERVAQAIPRDFVYDPATKGFRPAARPAGGGGGGTSSTTIGASWNGGGEVVKATGKVLFAMGSTYYVCSASVVDDAVSARSLVLTAAHCAYDETGHQFATNWMFVPDYDSAPAPLNTSGSFCASTSLGCWTATALVVHDGYATAGGFNNQAVVYDFAFAVVEAGGKDGTTQLDTTVGGHPIQFSSESANADTYLFGYPAAGKYKGKDLVYCRGPLGFDPSTANATYRVGCNMTGGSSGGPWFSPFNSGAGNGTLMSLNSYGYSGITAMHGPKFNANTQAVFNSAAEATTNITVDG
jgi:hypothetical protein